MSLSAPSLEALVWQRANSRCEYCQMPQALDPIRFEIDHIIAKKHGGLTSEDNLALSCFHCNSHKGPNIAGFDPLTGELVRLFHPRRDRWTEHFGWESAELRGLTDIGRTTIRVLVINHPELVVLRLSLIDEGIFPDL